VFGSELLDVAIGVVFIFFILSLMLTSAREIIEGVLQTRAINLERGIRELLNDANGTGLAKLLYEHPLVSSLYRGDYPALKKRFFTRNDKWLRAPFRSNLPAYIPTRNFATALLDLAGRGAANAGVVDTPLTFESVRNALKANVPDPKVRRAIGIALDQAQGDLEEARRNLEKWFDSGMDRVSGWYRKQTQTILILLGFLVAFGLNINTLTIASALYQNPALRSVAVTQAQAAVEASKRQSAAGGDEAALRQLIGCGAKLAPAGTSTPSKAGTAGAGAAEKAAAPASSNASAASRAGPPAPASADGAGSASGASPAAQPTQAEADILCAEHKIKSLGLPMGWGDLRPAHPWEFKTWGGWVGSFPWSSIWGWILTAFAVSLGAPFWFDLLNKMMVIRSTVKPHEKSPEEASEDRQPKPAPQITPPAIKDAPAAQPEAKGEAAPASKGQTSPSKPTP
jgi:hypothetical protein